jgi:hypothetical protein
VLARGALDLPYATEFVPAASLEAGVEGWFGFKYTTYSSIDTDSGALTFAGTLGSMAPNIQASGDIVTVPGGPTYMTAFDLNPNAGDQIVTVDPNTGEYIKTVNNGTQLSALVGLAQWAGELYIFSENGLVYRGTPLEAGVAVQLLAVTYDYGDAGAIEAGATDAGDAAIEASGPTPITWRGAAVTTRAPGN